MTIEKIKVIANFLHDIYKCAAIKNATTTIVGAHRLKDRVDRITLPIAEYSSNEETQILESWNLFWIANNSNVASLYQRNYLMDNNLTNPDQLYNHVMQFKDGLAEVLNEGRNDLKIPAAEERSKGIRESSTRGNLAHSSISSTRSVSSSSSGGSVQRLMPIGNINLIDFKTTSTGDGNGADCLHQNEHKKGMVTSQTSIEFVVTNFPGAGTSTSSTDIVHAEQRLLYTMMFLRRSFLFGQSLNIGGTKRACTECEPMLKKANLALRACSATLNFSTGGTQIHAVNSFNMDVEIFAVSIIPALSTEISEITEIPLPVSSIITAYLRTDFK